MQKILVIAKREFLQRARTRGFWGFSIGVPLILLLIGAATGLFSPAGEMQETAPSERTVPEQSIGYVDQADFIQSMPDTVPADLFVSFAEVEAAERALTEGQIGAFYIIQPDYRETGQVQRISPQLSINRPDVGWFNQLLTANLLPHAADSARIIKQARQPFNGSGGPEFINHSPQETSGSQSNPMLPFVVTMAIMLPLFTSGSYLFQGLTQEKSNRVMEILLVSLSPRQLLLGKIIGLSTLVLVQYTIWIALGVGITLLTNPEAGLLLGGLNLTISEMILVMLFALGGFLLYAGLMAGLGALSRDVEDSRVWLFIIGLPMMIPIYLGMTIINNPNDSLALTLSLFPFSAPVAMLMRLTSSTVPPWQLALSVTLLFATGLAVIGLMARLFRVQTLLSGEPMSLRRFWLTLWG